MNRWTHPALVLMVAVAWTAPSASAANAPRCALVPAERSNVTTGRVLALLESALAQAGVVQLVERAEVDRLLAEQSLDAALGAAGLRARQDLGRLLRADLLVILDDRRAGEQPALRVTIAETRAGLRLGRQVWPWDETQAEVTIAEIAGAVHRACLLQTEGVRAVFAIPPFECEDLTFEHEHLMGAYAAIVEQALTSRSGVVVVELEEAQALARELAVSDGATTVTRAPPYYVLGRYKTAGRGAELRTTLHVELRRREEALETIDRSDLRPEEAVAVLRDIAARGLAQAMGPLSTSAPAPADEAALLKQRAQLFKSLGHWEEARALYEASLLLEPNQPEAHLDVAQVYKHLVRELTHRVSCTNDATDRAGRALAFFRTGLEHIEFFLRGWQEGNPTPIFLFIQSFRDSLSSYFLGLSPDCNSAAQLRRLSRAHVLMLREALIRLLEEWTAADTLTEDRIVAATEPLFSQFWSQFLDEPPEEEYGQRLRVARLMLNSRSMWGRVEALAKNNLRQPIGLLGTEYDDFLTALEELPDARIPRIIAMVRADRDRDRAKREGASASSRPVTPSPGEPGPEVEFTPLVLSVHEEDGRVHPANIVHDWLACGDGVDVVMGRGLFRMTEPGRMDPVPSFVSAQPYGSPYGEPCFDGRYAWVPVCEAPTRLIVLDPLSGAFHEFGAEAGLPPANFQMRVVGLGLGRAFIYGRFDHNGAVRNWFALCEYDPIGGLSTRIVLEQRKQASYPHQTHWDPDPETAQPVKILGCLTGDKDEACRMVVVGQTTRVLLIDPRTGTLEIVRCADHDRGQSHVVVGDTIYWTEIRDYGHPTLTHRELCRANPPGIEAVDVARIDEAARYTDCAVDPTGTMHLVGSYWWQAAPPYGIWRRYRMNCDTRDGAIWNVRMSAHYGIVVVRYGAAFAVHFDEDPTTQRVSSE